jgi:hypothetical protein
VDQQRERQKIEENPWSLKFCIGLLTFFIVAGYLLLPTVSDRGIPVKPKAAKIMLSAISLALENYKDTLGVYPPDTVSDPCSLHRYLCRSIIMNNGKRYGPFLVPQEHFLEKFSEPEKLSGFRVIDVWGSPIYFVAHPARVSHNKEAFDLYSAGPDRQTPENDPGNGEDDINNWPER